MKPATYVWFGNGLLLGAMFAVSPMARVAVGFCLLALASVAIIVCVIAPLAQSTERRGPWTR